MKASIDIGTNSVLLLVCEITHGVIRVLHEKQAVPRLGKGVDKERNLHSDSCERVLHILRDYQNFLETIDTDLSRKAIVTATSAVRDANNRDTFMNLVHKATGWNIRLLSGQEEAQTTYNGALSVLNNRRETGNMIIDIGGGSTEISFGEGFRLLQGKSIDMGSVRFTERFFRNDPPTDPEIKRARAEIKKYLAGVEKPHDNFDVIGVAGTVTSLAAIHQKMGDYEANLLNGSDLGKDQLKKSIIEFSKLSYRELEEKYPPFLTGRGEVILAGALILDEILEWCGKKRVIVSTGGIRHGILLGE